MSELSDNGSCILIFDSNERRAELVDFFFKEGFQRAKNSRGSFGNSFFVFVNTHLKVFAFGMPGVEFARPFNEHAITIDEFYTIYNIYEKYRGLRALVMTKE